MSKEIKEPLTNLEDWVNRELVEREKSSLRKKWEEEELFVEGLGKERRKRQDIDYLKQEGGALKIFKEVAKILGKLFRYEGGLFKHPSPSVHLRSPKGTETKQLINGTSDTHIELRWDAENFKIPGTSGYSTSPFGIFDHSEGRQILCSIARQDNTIVGFRLDNHFKKEAIVLDNTALAKKLLEFIETAPKVRLSYKV